MQTTNTTISTRAAASQSPKLRLTRRGKAVVVLGAGLLSLGSVFGVNALTSTPAAATTEAQASNDFGYVLPMPGESLWQISANLDETADTRDLVAEIMRLNNLDTAVVRANEPLAVPAVYVGSERVLTASQVGL